MLPPQPPLPQSTAQEQALVQSMSPTQPPCPQSTTQGPVLQVIFPWQPELPQLTLQTMPAGQVQPLAHAMSHTPPLQLFTQTEGQVGPSSGGSVWSTPVSGRPVWSHAGPVLSRGGPS
jgi:hypothetical protein